MTAASLPVILRGGSGRRARLATMPGRSEANTTSRSGRRAIARKHVVTARLSGSVGDSLPEGLALLVSDMRDGSRERAPAARL
jgi:hypothetical protein